MLHRLNTTRIPLAQITIKFPQMVEYLTHVPYFADVPFAEVSGEGVCFVEHPLHVFEGGGVPVGYVAVELYRS